MKSCPSKAAFFVLWYFMFLKNRLYLFLRCRNNIIRGAPNILSSVRHFFAKKNGHGIPPAGGQAVGCYRYYPLTSAAADQVSKALLTTSYS